MTDAAEDALLLAFKESVELLASWSSGISMTTVISQIPDHRILRELLR